MEDRELYLILWEILRHSGFEFPTSPVMHSPKLPDFMEELESKPETWLTYFLAFGALGSLSLAYQGGPSNPCSAASFGAATLSRQILRDGIIRGATDPIKSLGQYLVYEEPTEPEAAGTLELHAMAATQILLPLRHEFELLEVFFLLWRFDAQKQNYSERHLDRLEELVEWYSTAV